MKERLLDLIACPKCKTKLYLRNAVYEDNEIISGFLTCNKCDSNFPVRGGIPRLLVDSDRIHSTAKGFGNLFKLRFKGKFEGETLYGESEEEELTIFFDKLIVKPSDLDQKLILDAGCGVGRLTKNLGKFGCEVIGIDIQDSIEIAFRNCQEYPNVHILQADIFNLPFSEQIFDYIWCEGVLPYTHNPRLGFSKLSSILSTGGKIYVWVYSKNGGSTFFLRRILRNSYKLPSPILYFIVNIIAFFYTAFMFLNGKGKPWMETHRQRSFSYYDTLSQKHMYQFDINEIINWFKEEEFTEIIETERNGIGITGIK